MVNKAYHSAEKTQNQTGASDSRSTKPFAFEAKVLFGRFPALDHPVDLRRNADTAHFCLTTRIAIGNRLAHFALAYFKVHSAL